MPLWQLSVGVGWFGSRKMFFSLDMIFDNFLSSLRNIPIDEGEEGVTPGKTKQDVLSPTLQVSLVLC